LSHDRTMEWLIQSQDKEKTRELASALGSHELLAWVLLNRGLQDPAECEAFLSPTLDQLSPGDEWPADMEKAVDRIARSLDKGDTIGVHGDYDADGVTATALISLFLRSVGAKSVWHLPHRRKEGYGMRPSGVDILVEKGAGLIITVDCGISDFEAIQHAEKLGIDVIVVDHHQLPDKMPPAYAVINHNRLDCPFQKEHLSGAGLAFYLAAAVRAKLRDSGAVPESELPNMLSMLDLAALGTVADVVPLLGRNRVITRFGLEQLNRGGRPGIMQLRRVAGLLKRPVSAGSIAFQLAPRINAAGRMDSGDPALRMLMAADERRAGEYADELEKMNRTRQEVEERILEEALAQVERIGDPADLPITIAAGEDWHIGVIGIVASRLVEKYYRPALVIGMTDGVGKGSLRSVTGINIYEALAECADLLDAFGGHPMAAGITVREENLAAFSEKLSLAVGERAVGAPAGPVLKVDAEWPVNRWEKDLVKQFARLKPHGIGNPEPAFCARGVRVKWARTARKDTLVMEVSEGGTDIRAVGFRMAHLLPRADDRVDIVYVPEIDNWEGRDEVRLRIKDLKVVA